MTAFRFGTQFGSVHIKKGAPERKVVLPPLEAGGLLHSGMNALSPRMNVFAARKPLTSLMAEQQPPPPTRASPSSASSVEGTLSAGASALGTASEAVTGDAKQEEPDETKITTTNPSLARKDTSVIYHL